MTDIEVRKTLSDNLRRLRNQRGISQLKLANELQMAMTFINDIENCKKWVSPETLAKFATFYKVSIADLFSAENEKSRTETINVELLFTTLTAEIQESLQNVKKRFST